MKRKVIQIAESTQLISLPRKWAIKYGIKKGDELDIDEQSNKLIISTDSEKRSETKTIDISGFEDYRKTLIAATYLKGYDEVEIIFGNPEYAQQIQELMNWLSGYDLVKQNKNSCVVKQISKVSVKEFESMRNRIFLSLHESGEFLMDAIKNKHGDISESIKFREKVLHRGINFCKRILNKTGYEDNLSTIIAYLVMTLLEQYGDAFKNLAYELVKNDYKISSEDFEIIKRINSLFSQVHKFYQNKQISLAIQNHKEFNDLKKKLAEIKQSKKFDFNIYHWIWNMNRIVMEVQEATLPLAV